jgi:hypothetical protein
LLPGFLKSVANRGILRVLDWRLMKHHLLPPNRVQAWPIFIGAHLDDAIT